MRTSKQPIGKQIELVAAEHAGLASANNFVTVRPLEQLLPILKHKPVIIRNYRDLRVQRVCGLPLSYFAQLIGITPQTLRNFLTRKHSIRTDTALKIVNTINTLKTYNAVTFEWVVKYLRHNVSMIPEAELLGTYETSDKHRSDWFEYIFNQNVVSRSFNAMGLARKSWKKPVVKGKPLRPLDIIPVAQDILATPESVPTPHGLSVTGTVSLLPPVNEIAARRKAYDIIGEMVQEQERIAESESVVQLRAVGE